MFSEDLHAKAKTKRRERWSKKIYEKMCDFSRIVERVDNEK